MRRNCKGNGASSMINAEGAEREGGGGERARVPMCSHAYVHMSVQMCLHVHVCVCAQGDGKDGTTSTACQTVSAARRFPGA